MKTMLMLLVLLPFAAFAQDVVTPATSDLLLRLSTDPTDLEAGALLLLSAVVNGQWGLLVSVLLMALVAGLRKWLPGHTVVGKWFLTRVGTVTSTLAISLAGAFAAAFLSHGSLTLPLVIKAVTVAISASGIWSIGQAIKEDIDEKKAQKAGAVAAAEPPPSSTLDK